MKGRAVTVRGRYLPRTSAKRLGAGRGQRRRHIAHRDRALRARAEAAGRDMTDLGLAFGVCKSFAGGRTGALPSGFNPTRRRATPFSSSRGCGLAPGKAAFAGAAGAAHLLDAPFDRGFDRRRCWCRCRCHRGRGPLPAAANRGRQGRSADSPADRAAPGEIGARSAGTEISKPSSPE